MRWIMPMLVGVLAASATASAVPVFTTDFESGLPAELSAPGASIQAVQGWAGLGPAGTQFAGGFLRYDGTDVTDTQLTLTGLPPHQTLSLGFLLAVIDSWDGVELFEVVVDGTVLFSHSFQLATGDSSSYVDPPGALLSSGTDLGFSAGSYYSHDRAYDLSVEPAFADIPHTADSVTIVWRLNAIPGGGADFWQGGGDESWAIDNLTVGVDDGTTTTTVSPTTTTTTSAPAAPARLSGRKLLLKWRADAAKGRVLDLLSRDPALTLRDGPGTPDDPTLHGGSLRVFAAGGDGFDDTYDLPAGQWRYLSRRKPERGYRFGRGAPITSVLVKPGKAKIVGHGTALGHTLAADPRPVLVELRLGDARYCLAFGGTAAFTPDKKFLAKGAPPATDCPP